MKRLHITHRPQTMLWMLMVLFVFIAVIIIPVQASGLSDPLPPTVTPSPSSTDTAAPEVDTAPNPGLLLTPSNYSMLASSRTLNLLAGELIFHGLVNASSCPDGGLLKNHFASPCGEMTAHNATILWQNQFDQAIYETAVKQGIPPYLLKNVIAQESQFWPGNTISKLSYAEYGLGQITTMGADTALRWNSPFAKALCLQVYNDDTCKTPYVLMPAEQQALLRGAILQRVNAECSSCVGGVDIQKARESVVYVAAALRGSRNSAAWYLQGLTGRSFESLEAADAWRLTLISYHSGPACLGSAISRAKSQNLQPNWKNISASLDKGCRSSIDYIKAVKNIDIASPDELFIAQFDTSKAALIVANGLGYELPVQVEATPASSPTPTADPALTATPTLDPSITATATSTVDPSITETATPSPEPAATATPSPTATSIPSPTPTPVVTETPPARGKTTQIIVRFHKIVPNFVAARLLKDTGGALDGEVQSSTFNLVSVPAQRVDAILAELNSNLLVDYAEPNYSLSAFYTPNDPGLADQANLVDMQVPQAWDVTKGKDVVVAVIDTGLDFTHPELMSNLWTNPGETGTDISGNDKSINGIDDDNDGFVDDVLGWNFVEGNGDFSDLNGHGTHSAGIIAAAMDNSLGIAGIAPEAKIMPLRVLDAQGRGTYANVAQAIFYAVDHGAQVINLGFGGVNNSNALREATDYAYSHGVVVVAAAGNGGSDVLYYPAANPNVIAVEALDPARNLTAFSTYGYTYSVAAPGVGIYSTLPDGQLGHMTGTSMSAAEVSGIAALLVSQPAKFNSVDDVRFAIFGSALNLGAPGHDLIFGYGLVQANDALNYDPSAFATPTPPAEPGPATPTPSEDGGVIVQADAANANISNYARSCPGGIIFGALGGTPVPAVQVDDGVSSAIPLGFDFWYMGTRYTSVYASSNGWLSFVDPAGNSYPNNNTPTLSNPVPRPMLAPLWDDLSGAGGTASYSTTGTAPNRMFTFEWSNWRWGRTAAGAVISFRVELYESTGVIRYRYVQNGTPVTLGSASSGMTSSNTGSGNFLAVNPGYSFSSVCPTWVTTTDSADIAVKPPSGRIHTFTPPTPANPADLRITSTTATTVTLTWTDNANNETGYVVYASTDGVNFTTQAGTTSGWQSAAVSGTGSTGTTTVTGLTDVKNLYFRVYAVSEGRLSAVPAAIAPPSTLIFSNVQPTSVTLNWTDSPNDAGYIILNSTNGTDYNFVAQVPTNSTSYNATGLTAGTSYAWRVHAINPSAVSSGIEGSVPALDITAPLDGSTFVQSDTITFTAVASDAISGDLADLVTWTSDIDGVLGTGGLLNKTGMSLGQHTITASVTSASGLTATDSITVIITDASGNVPPLLTITAPATESSYIEGSNITFTGTAMDMQDGDLSASIEWRSNINGLIGTGASVSTSTLSIGTHTITARVTDLGGLTSTRTIRVYVTTTGGALPPELTILTPADGATFQSGTNIGFLGSANIRSSGDISEYIQWTSSLDGTLASNTSSFGTSALSAGSHTITASVTDDNSGLTSTDSITITISTLPIASNPHGNFNGSTDTCVICHNPHSALSWGPLIGSQSSPYENNNYCLNCHSTGANTYSTHSNKDVDGELEQPFELLCIQCHDPHDNQPNLSAIRSPLVMGTLPTTFDVMPETGSQVIFTARTGANSFDDGSSLSASRLCVACHENASNPGAPMTLHTGGAGHSGGVDYTGQDCTACHSHNPDGDVSTRDGFTTTCRACHSQPQDLGNGTPRRQIVGVPAGSGGNDNDFARASHHVSGNDTVTDADCKVCHEMSQHKQGKVRLYNQDAPSTVYALDYQKNAADDPADYKAFCLSCHDANGKNGNIAPFSDKKLIPALNTSLWTFAQHNLSLSSFTGSCLDCHSNGHGSNKASLLSKYSATAPWDYQYTGSGAAPADVMDQEEDFCFKCHSAGGPGNSIQSAFTSYVNTATRIFKHDVSAAYEKHNPGEVFAASFTGVNRHIECTDCHNSHAANNATNLAPTLQGEMRGSSGVEPRYGAAGSPSGFNVLATASAEYQICMKCHSSYTTAPTYLPDGWGCTSTPCTRTYIPNGLRKLTSADPDQVLDPRDLARAFNPNNASYHPVMAVGKGMWNLGFVGTWNINSRVYCSDCHSNATPTTGNAGLTGPHGSPLLHILLGSAPETGTNYATVSQFTRNGEPTVPSTSVCFKCHDYATYVTSTSATNTHFRNGADNYHSRHMNGVYTRTTCYTCHNSHGSVSNQHLINFDVAVAAPTDGRNSETAWEWNNATGTGYCFVACHGMDHTPETYRP